jgi:catechol 2,3-dioxygenase-like lactoylglutathione lyase family enzyme
MNPHITLLTLGVDDLERAVAFYRDGLGLSTKGVIGAEFENGAVAFFDLQAGARIVKSRSIQASPRQAENPPTAAQVQ